MRRRFEITDLNLLSDLVESDTPAPAEVRRESTSALPPWTAEDAARLQADAPAPAEPISDLNPYLLAQNKPPVQVGPRSFGIAKIIAALSVAALAAISMIVFHRHKSRHGKEVT
jgi:hypothetical protein